MGPTGLVNKYIKYLNISSILLLINNIKFLFYLKNNSKINLNQNINIKKKNNNINKNK